MRLVSITQPVGDESEPVQAMMRKVIALFDEYQSKENAKHVIRSMKENARQGFWNGSMAPLGYRLVEADTRGTKVKKKLDVDLVEAETVRLIFRLYLHGDDKSGALGVKEVVKWLNARGYRTRRGQTFGVGSIHKLGDATRSVQNCTLRAPRQFRLPKTFRVMSVAGAKTGPFDDSGRGVLTQPDLPGQSVCSPFRPPRVGLRPSPAEAFAARLRRSYAMIVAIMRPCGVVRSKARPLSVQF